MSELFRSDQKFRMVSAPAKGHVSRTAAFTKFF